MLTLSDYSVSIQTKEILHHLSYTFPDGTITALLGHNGSGKSSLALSLMWHPRYTVAGEVLYAGARIETLSPTERQARGIFLSLQNIPEIPGIKVHEYLRTIYHEHFRRAHPGEKIPSSFVFRRMVEKLLPDLRLDVSILDRDLFVGFSGGEKRRIELLQIELLDPSCIILDEIDSGLDIDAVDTLQEKIAKWRSEGKTLIIISHNFWLLDAIDVDHVLILKDWQIDRHGEKNLLQVLKTEGFR